MSTKMSTDLNITRPSSRVLRAPGGGSSFSIGGDNFDEPVKSIRKVHSNNSSFSIGESNSNVSVVNKGTRHVEGKSTFTIGNIEQAVPVANENANSAANRRRNAGGGASTLQLF